MVLVIVLSVKPKSFDICYIHPSFRIIICWFILKIIGVNLKGAQPLQNNQIFFSTKLKM